MNELKKLETEYEEVCLFLTKALEQFDYWKRVATEQTGRRDMLHRRIWQMKKDLGIGEE